MDHCPICSVSVKPENLLRHLNDIHPRHPDTPRLREQLKTDPGRLAPKRTTGPLRLRRYHVLIIVLVAVAGLGGYYVLSQPPAAADIVTHCGVEGIVVHYHPLLVINDHGVQKPLPYDSTQAGDIGYISQPGFTNPKYYCAAGQFHLLHTHDGSGIIHVELPQVVSTAPTLGDFFTIWGEPLGPSQVWSVLGQVHATMYDSDTHTSTDFSSNPAVMPLYEPAAGPQGNAYLIPQSLIFNGAYGSGASGGGFSGEIIWLNVTA
jgi:hypothetical protein